MSNHPTAAPADQNTHEEAQADAFDLLIENAIGEAIDAPDYATFRTWFTTELEASAHGLEHTAPDSSRITACQLSRAVWNVTPRAEIGFRTQPIAEPSRNDRCLIGLDCKVKQCCGAQPRFPALASDYVWSVLGDILEAEVLADALESKRVPKRVAPFVAHTLVEEDPRLARGVLEALFAGSLDRCDEDESEMLMSLADAYAELGDTAAERAHLERMTAAGSKFVRTDGWRGIANFELVAGNPREARLAFERAMGLERGNPTLARLEIALLVAEDRIEDAKHAATKWLADLRGSDFPDVDPDLSKFLETAQHDPREALKPPADIFGENPTT